MYEHPYRGWFLGEMRRMYQKELRQRAAQEQLAEAICDAAQLRLVGEASVPELEPIEDWNWLVMRYHESDNTPSYPWAIANRSPHLANYASRWRWNLSY